MNEKENLMQDLKESINNIREEISILSLTLLFVNEKLTYKRYRQAIQEVREQQSSRLIPNYLGKFI
jgi:hypothetical protein